MAFLSTSSQEEQDDQCRYYMYYWIRENWTLEDTIVESPELDNDEIDFLSGSLIPVEEITKPLVFEVTFEPDAQPHHYFDYNSDIPVVSSLFVKALGHAGIDNFQTFPAILRNSEMNVEWTDYFAFNVIGMINATDTDKSLYGEIMGGNDEGMPSLGIFTALALHEDRINDWLMFREPVGGNLVISENALDLMGELSPDGGFGIIADEVTLT